MSAGSPWAGFLGRRIVGLLAVLLVLVVATFLMVRLVPGDPVRRIAGQDATAQDIANLRESLGLDRPLPAQFADYMVRLAQFDLGRSFVSREPVSQIIAQRLPETLTLATAAFVLVMVSSLVVGTTAAAITRDGRGSRFEVGFMAVTSILGSLPSYLTATFLVFLLAVVLGWLPVAGAGRWNSFILPTVALSLRPIAILSRIIRVETLNVLAQDYIRTARSKRLPTSLLFWRHVLPSMLTSSLTLGGLLLAGLIGGAVIIENVFAWPGMGTALVQAVLARDYPVVQGVTLLLGVAVVMVNLLIDVMLAAIDPRTLLRSW